MSLVQNLDETQERPQLFFDFTVYSQQITQNLLKREAKQFEKELRTQEDTLESNDQKLRSTISDCKKIKIVKKMRKRKSTAIRCVHTDRKHHAKGLCKQCYGRQGITTLATACEHTTKFAHARDMCRLCYFKWYNRFQREANKDLVLLKKNSTTSINLKYR